MIFIHKKGNIKEEMTIKGISYLNYGVFGVPMPLMLYASRVNVKY